MSKRPYYIIYYTTEYDGYRAQIKYIGTNFKAARDRYYFLREYIIQHYFLDEGVQEDRIEKYYADVPDNMHIGETICSSMNDGDMMYDTLSLACVDTLHFFNNDEERKYKIAYPNSKF